MAKHPIQTLWKTRFAISIMISALLFGPTVDIHESAAATLEPTQSTIDPVLATEETAAVNAARQRYTDAGLEFPDVDIRFHGDPAYCYGNDGYYRLWFDGTATIDVCYPQADPDIRHIPRTRTLWHELAHAYIEPRIDEATKAALLELLYLPDWDEGSWSELGKENAAEILVWGIAGGRYKPWDVTEFDCPTKAAAYTLLTGLAGPTC